ncbi:MAG: NUDIX domain-containing protein [Planctomycetota bacterium]
MPPKPIELCYQFCPRCGASVKQSAAIPFRCTDCEFAQFFGPVAAVGALVMNDNGDLLLVRRARDPGAGKWGLPGGFVDREETIEDAMRREVKEETQLELRDTQYLMSHPNQYDYRGIVSPVIDLFYTARAVKPASIQLAQEELDHHVWVRPSKVHLDEMAFHSNRLAVERWLQDNDS